jgi:hypothetical protein
MATTKRKNWRAGKKPARSIDRQKKTQSTKTIAPSVRDAAKRQPVKSTIIKERSNLLIKAPRSEVPNVGETRQVKNRVTPGLGGAQATVPLAVAEKPLPSMFASQMQLLSTLLKWSPLSMMVRQQALLTDMV